MDTLISVEAPKGFRMVTIDEMRRSKIVRPKASVIIWTNRVGWVSKVCDQPHCWDAKNHIYAVPIGYKFP